MRLIEYYLMPESGYTGEYDRKEQHYMIKKGTIAEEYEEIVQRLLSIPMDRPYRVKS